MRALLGYRNGGYGTPILFIPYTYETLIYTLIYSIYVVIYQ